MKSYFTNKNIALLGYGKEGKSTLRFLHKIGIKDEDITLLDGNENIDISLFSGKKILGEKYLDSLEEFDLIIKTPGISLYHEKISPHRGKIITQAGIFYKFYSGKIISVTQTKGKSTTVTGIYNLLKNAGQNVKLVGNIGNPVLDEIDLEKNIFDFVVFELSSYMLEDLQDHHSYISILGNIYRDHLDWHKNFENYSNAKKNILKNSQNILIGQGLYPKIQKDLLNRNFLTFGQESSYLSHSGNDFFINGVKIGTGTPKIAGDHNLDNFCALLGVSHILGISNEIFFQTINNFFGLPHRLQNIGTYTGIIFIDDAISTTPESTIEAIKSFQKSLETIFLGGTDRGYIFDELIKIIQKTHIKNIVLFPESGENIKKLLKIEDFNILETSSMQEAVEFAFKNTQKGKICMLSTASPSYSIWKNFEEKGNLFQKEIFNQYKKFEQ